MEQEVTFKSGGLQLSGTLRLPDTSDQKAAVLLVAGSGQVDRNENHRKLQINALGMIADDLEKRRIATFRYDKRGVGASGGNYWETGFYDNISDAAAALAYLKSDSRLGGVPVFVLGHSEGALICTRLAAEGQSIAGAVLVAGSAQTGEAILRWQAVEVAKGLKGINGFIIRLFHIDVLKAQDKALKKINLSSRDWIRQGLVRKLNAKWLREFMSYDPAADLARIEVPVLAVTGSKDIQVDPKDPERMAGIVKGDFEYHVIPDMTHLLRPEAGEASISTYREQARRPLDPRLLEYIGEWLGKHTAVTQDSP